MLNESIQSVRTGGLFAASFFGPEDDWAQSGKVTELSALDLRIALKEFKILHLHEIKKQSITVVNGDKLLHSVEVIAHRNKVRLIGHT